MTDDMHPQVSAVLRQARRLQSLMDDQLAKMADDSFTATDEARTVEVTLDGHHWLVDVFIEAGLLRLGADTVTARLREALLNAGVSASATIDADRERIDLVVVEITSELKDATQRD